MNARTNFMPVLLMIVLWMTACEGRPPVVDQPQTTRNMNESTAKNVEVRTDLEGLEKQINLPVRPAEAKWTAETFDNSKGAVPGPSDYRLTALLKYDAKDAAELVKKLAAATPEKATGSADVKAWFPDEIKALIKTVDDRKYLEGPKYAPDAFFRAPYLNGNLIRVGETNYFVLNLFSF